MSNGPGDEPDDRAGWVPSSWAPRPDPGAVESFAVGAEAAGLPVRRQHPIGPATTLGVGGPAAAWVDLPDVAAVSRFAALLSAFPASDLPVFLLGKGSNTLVADSGFPGVVAKLGRALKWLRRDEDTVSAGAAEAMPALAAWAAREGLAGLEFAAGIPATVGGSIRMNAGAHGSDTAAALESVDIFVAGDREVRTLPAAALAAGYRHTSLPERAVIVGARWALRPDDPVAIRARLDELRAWRRATQPLGERNCGSVFANPPGATAGALIEAAGLKGYRVGGARISAKHANFIEAPRGASAADVYALIALARSLVAETAGFLLVPEVRLIGDFSAAR